MRRDSFVISSIIFKYVLVTVSKYSLKLNMHVTVYFIKKYFFFCMHIVQEIFRSIHIYFFNLRLAVEHTEDVGHVYCISLQADIVMQDQPELPRP